MSALPFMRVYWKDYLSKTANLSTSQHGAYLLILAQMWISEGSLPYDDKILSRLVRATPEVWTSELWPVLRPYFRVRRGRLLQSRLREEMTKARRSEAAKNRSTSDPFPRHKLSVDAASSGKQKRKSAPTRAPDSDLSYKQERSSAREASVSGKPTPRAQEPRKPDPEMAKAVRGLVDELVAASRPKGKLQ